MAQVSKIDSNVTGLSYAEEASPGVLPAAPFWVPLEPNSYADFGGEITTIARNPINPSRQRKKGVVTDLDATGGFATDVTQENLQDMLQGFFFASLRNKAQSTGARLADEDIVNVDGTTDEYDLTNREVATAVVGTSGGTGYVVGDVLTVAGGTAVTPATLTVTGVAGGVITTVSILEPGAYSAEPTLTNNAVTGGSGTGGQINLTMQDIQTYRAGDLLFAKGFSDAANNGLKTVSGITAGLQLAVNEDLIDEVPSANAQVAVVGFELGTAEADIDVTGTLPRLVRAGGTKDFTQFGLIPGEWVFIGGDGAGEAFANPENNGFKRVRQVGATFIEFDKSDSVMSDETGTGLTIRLFFGRVLKNELGSLIRRRTYQLERQLGVPDDAFPAQVQSEYIVGATPNEASFNIPTADKFTADLSFIAQDAEQRTGATGLKSGTRETLVEADAFNTSSDFSRIRMAQVVTGNEAPTALFAFLTDLTVTVNNNVSPNKAVGVLGSFDVTAGTFQVGGTLTAYFADVAAVQAVRNNADITLDAILVKSNSGIALDLPLISLGDGRPAVEQDQPITLPLNMDAATAAKIDPTLDYTAMMVFFDYLPDLADS